jgi:hypothetical protein
VIGQLRSSRARRLIHLRRFLRRLDALVLHCRYSSSLPPRNNWPALPRRPAPPPASSKPRRTRRTHSTWGMNAAIKGDPALNPRRRHHACLHSVNFATAPHCRSHRNRILSQRR